MKKMILDLDTGVDDALAISYALGSPEVELIGITGTYGNVLVEQGVRNALAVTDLLGHPEVKVYQGLSHSSTTDHFEVLPISAFIHGDNGIGDVDIPDSNRSVETESAVDFIIDAVKTYGKDLIYVPTGPMTNIEAALKKAPVYRTEGVGEDWEGLKAAVSGSTLSNKDKILFIIEHNSNDTERESAIRELDNDKTYHILLEEFYPALRRTTFSLSFDVRPYTSEELPGVFETKPECLSLYEMYQLAGLYASRGENPLPVYKKAYEQFPGDIVAVLNYANALLKYGKDADGALQVLEVVREDSRVLFPMAIAYDMKGDWRKAEKLLEEAAARGCNRAKAFKAVRVNE